MVIPLYEHMELPLSPLHYPSQLDLQDSAPFWLNAYTHSIRVL